MNRRTKKKLRKRFYSYIYLMEINKKMVQSEGDSINQVAQRIVDDVELYVLELNNQIKVLQELEGKR